MTLRKNEEGLVIYMFPQSTEINPIKIRGEKELLHMTVCVKLLQSVHRITMPLKRIPLRNVFFFFFFFLIKEKVISIHLS